MIDLQEAERIALIYALEQLGIQKIASTIERPFGWVFHLSAKEGCIPGAIRVAVELENGRLTQLSTAFATDTTIAWFEEGLQWRTMHDKALNLAKESEFSEAESLLLESINFVESHMSQRIGGAASEATIEMTIVSMNSLGQIYMQKGDQERAVSIFLQAKSLLDELFPLKSFGRGDQRAPVLLNLIDYYMKSGLRFDADIIKRELALAYFVDWKFEKAQSLSEELLQKRSEIYLDNHPRLAQTLTDLAKIKNAQQQYYLAGLYFERSVKLWDWLSENPQRLSEFVDAKHHTSVAEFQQMLVDTLEAYAPFLSQRPGKSEEAASIKKRANELKQLLV